MKQVTIARSTLYVDITLFCFSDYAFYYHHPGMKLIALVIAISVGLFHEAHWTWLVNDLLGVAAAYVTIARVEVNIQIET